MFWKILWLWGGLIYLCTGAADAGAWPRGKGKIFVSSSASLTWPTGRAFEYPDIYGSGYAEYGVSKRLTLGLDLGSSDAMQPNRLKAIGFLRYSLSDPSARHQFALDLGAGTHLGDGVLRIGASYGTGLELLSRSGWLSIDTNMLFNPAAKGSTRALDATLGVNLNKGKFMGQFSAYQAESGATSFSFTPSYAHKLNDKRHVEIGVTFDLQGAPEPALKLGVWQDF